MMIKDSLACRVAGAILLLGIFSSSAAAQSGHGGGPTIPSDAIRLPCCLCVDGTSKTFNIDTGTGAWQVATPNSSTFQPVIPAANAAWAPVPPAGWVGPAGNNKIIGRYPYRLRFWYPPTCLIPARVTITGSFAADNSARLNIDGQFIIASQGPTDYGFLPASVTPFSHTLAPGGLHAITLTVNNAQNVTGMILQGTIWVTCPAQGADGTVSWLSRPPPRGGAVDRRPPPHPR
jgi:hypothetical protein